MWSDNETTLDLLDFAHLKSAVISVIENQNLLPATIGIFGDWGSGKSSLMQMVQAELKNKENVLCLSFNGWIFEGYEDAKCALMSSILYEVEQNRTLSQKGKAILKTLYHRVDKMKLASLAIKHGLAFALAGPVGLGLSASTDLLPILKNLGVKTGDIKLEDFASVLKQSEATRRDVHRSIVDFRNEFETLLAESKIDRLVVLVDDLDRCTPDRIIETLEAIKLFFYVQNTAFIVGADERLVQDAVRRRFPEFTGQKTEVGRDYLEKLVQFPVRVPQLNSSEMETYISLLFLDISGMSEEDRGKAITESVRSNTDSLYTATFGLKKAQELFGELPTSLTENLALAQQIAPVLAAGLNGNPRQCKRFLNTLLMRLGMAASRGIEIKRQILAKLMLLEYFRSEFFKQLAEIVVSDGLTEEIGKIELVAISEGEEKPVATSGVGGKGLKKEAAQTSLITKLMLSNWLEDDFVNDWLRMEPRLSGEELRPYFFFSRDVLMPMGQVLQRLSHEAQSVYLKLMHASEAIRRNASNAATRLSETESSALFDVLVRRTESAEELSGEASPLTALLALVNSRASFLGQLVMVLDRLPVKSLPMNVVPQIQRIDGSKEHAGVRALFNRWQTCENLLLAKASSKAIR